MERAYVKWVWIVVAALAFSSCQEDVGNSLNPTSVEGSEVSGDEQYLNLDSDVVFDQDKLHTYELILPEENLAIIDANPAAEQYVEGSLVFQGDTISPVGVRYKGSIGAFVGCLSGSNVFVPSGSKTCTKLSMKIKINYADPELKFYGLKKLQFHSMNQDDSQMRERLGYWLFDQMNVPAPRAVHARLVINGVYSGVYALVEQIDGRFSRYHFDGGDGNIYKETWPIDSDGHAYTTQRYLNGLKTNEDENPSVAIIEAFGKAIEQSEGESLLTAIESYNDIDEILRYSVVDRVIRHDDGPFHWYCTGSNCSNHNYYWYEDPIDLKLHLIAWDMDNAFENLGSQPNAVTNIPDAWGKTSNNCEPFSSGFFVPITQRSAACDKLINGWTQYLDEYEQIKSNFIDGPFSQASADAMLDKWAGQISAATQEARSTHGDAVSLSQWQSAIEELKAQMEVGRSL